jgi:pyridoxamine 5'-phosphate oxidase
MSDTPHDFIAAALAALERSAREREGEFRNVQLATVGADGAPGLRTLVLRALRPGEAELHTDARATKVSELERDGRAVLLAWSPEQKLQVRLSGTVRLHRDDAVARSRWDELPEPARAAYGLQNEPGAPIADPADRTYLPPEERFRRCFAVMLLELERVDVLRLEPHGAQARAGATIGTGGGLAGASWIGP